MVRSRISAASFSTGDRAKVIPDNVLAEDAAGRLDRFDAIQLADASQVCRRHATASAAGRALFSQSRLEKKSSNDADVWSDTPHGSAWDPKSFQGSSRALAPIRIDCSPDCLFWSRAPMSYGRRARDAESEVRPGANLPGYKSRQHITSSA
jgi:hypothetical protein